MVGGKINVQNRKEPFRQEYIEDSNLIESQKPQKGNVCTVAFKGVQAGLVRKGDTYQEKGKREKEK
jgi:hypothetical protein